jgi:hypothetical protein
MTRSDSRPLAAPHYEGTTFVHHARTLALHHGDRILGEIPTTLRRVGLFMLVMSIAIPAFLGGLLVVLFLFAR